MSAGLALPTPPLPLFLERCVYPVSFFFACPVASGPELLAGGDFFHRWRAQLGIVGFLDGKVDECHKLLMELVG